MNVRKKIIHSGGFTLIEIMLVVVIIGILAAFMVPRFAGKQEKAKIAKAKAEIAVLATALDSFHMDVGRYPTSEEGLASLMTRPSGIGTDVQWDGPYVRELLADPWNHAYQYRCPGEIAVDYDISSFGPDGQEGGEDDIYNVQNRNKNGQSVY